MVGKPINLSYLVVGLKVLEIFEIRFGEKVHIVQGINVKIDQFWRYTKIVGKKQYLGSIFRVWKHCKKQQIFFQSKPEKS